MHTFIELTDSYFCILGVLDNERIIPQKIDAFLRYEISMPQDDAIESALDYTEVKEHMRQFVHTSEFQLIETLAQKLLHSLLETYPLISATLRLTKEECHATVEVSK